MNIALVTDAWRPQINGVVTTLNKTRQSLEKAGHRVHVISPENRLTVPCPTYPEIRLALLPGAAVSEELEQLEPDAIHIATEGPLGGAARAYCRRKHLHFTSSFHTQFPQYLRKRIPFPVGWSYSILRRHHQHARRTLVPTEQVRRELEGHGFDNVVIWSRGVDTTMFRPLRRDTLDVPRPITMYVGRVAVEKNLDDFLGARLRGTRIVVGNGPDMDKLKRKYPKAIFAGYRFGDELAQYLSAADAFVFPSRTDTFGLVMLEAMACGTPVAAYPVTGPVDVVQDGFSGALDEDLAAAVERALLLRRSDCRAAALARTWERATEQFFGHLVCANDGRDLHTTRRVEQARQVSDDAIPGNWIPAHRATTTAESLVHQGPE